MASIVVRSCSMTLVIRILGLLAAAVFVTAGLAVAAALLPLLIGLGMITAIAVLCVRQEESARARTWLARSPHRFGVCVMGGVIVAGLAVIGMATLLGGAVTALAGATVLALLVHRRLRRGEVGDTEHATGRRPGSARTGSPDAGAPPVGAHALLPPDSTTLSDDELCRAWRLSYLLLPNARVAAELEHASLLRRRYLDELACRDPAGFRRWLDEGARAASDPSRYIRRRPGPAERDEDQAA
jgi:hypothetical protein